MSSLRRMLVSVEDCFCFWSLRDGEDEHIPEIDAMGNEIRKEEMTLCFIFSRLENYFEDWM